MLTFIYKLIGTFILDTPPVKRISWTYIIVCISNYWQSSDKENDIIFSLYMVKLN